MLVPNLTSSISTMFVTSVNIEAILPVTTIKFTFAKLLPSFFASKYLSDVTKWSATAKSPGQYSY